MIINLTQHKATKTQRKAGVVDLPDDKRVQLQDALTVNELPDRQDVLDRAETIAALAVNNGLGGDDSDDPTPQQVMIGGAPWLMSALESALINRDIKPVYAFSRRESADEPQADGTIRKVQVFRHLGFVRL